MSASNIDGTGAGIQPKIVTACVLIIGNEILSGRTQDENLGFLARGLNEIGIRTREARVIPDIHDVIVSSVNDVRQRFDYVFTTGGIGPTHDDITAQCIADAFGVPVILHPDAKRLLEAHYPGGEGAEPQRQLPSG
jgi:molybdenum cofactor synthesis domain-containing protein